VKYPLSELNAAAAKRIGDQRDPRTLGATNMLTRLRNLWRPANFHYHHRLARGGGFFEGWYFKLVDANGSQPYAIIPGVFLGEDAHAFIQVLDGRLGESAYHRFPLESFRADRDVFRVEIGNSRFSSEGISLDIDGTGTAAEQRVVGTLSFSTWRPWPVTAISPGVMGPYSFVPAMQCNHGILSMDHRIDGSLSVDGRETNFDAGRGYAEKDWGSGFPAGYVWTQSNHFAEAGVSLSASVAHIPWLTGAFRGFLVGFMLDDELHRFTTYTGAKIESLTLSDKHLRLRIRNREHRLEVDSLKSEGGILHAPYGKSMVERVAETMTSEVELRLSSLTDDRTVYTGHGRHACLEVQGRLPAVLDTPDAV
jgi:tocopherol cyclase